MLILCVFGIADVGRRSRPPSAFERRHLHERCSLEQRRQRMLAEDYVLTFFVVIGGYDCV